MPRWRWRSSSESPRRRSSRRLTRAPDPHPGRRCCRRCCSRCWRRPRRPAVASTGATRRSSARTRGSSNPCSESSAPTGRWRLSSVFRREVCWIWGRGFESVTSRSGEIAAHWPQARGLLPAGFEREVDRRCVLELEQALPGDAGPPDAPGELADAVTALRLASAGPIAAGPVVFERLDWRPYGIRPVLPIAATPPPGEPVRIDPLTAERAKQTPGAPLDGRRRSRARRGARPLGALALPGRPVRIGAAARLARPRSLAQVRGSSRRRCERRRCSARLHASAPACSSGSVCWPREMQRWRREISSAVRSSQVLEEGDRAKLVVALDESLLGLRPKPTTKLEPVAAVGAL